MRIKTPLTKKNIATHFVYNSWKYLVVLVLAIMGWNLIYTTTAYRSPQNKRIDVYVQSATASNEMMDAFLEPIWRQTVPDMEVVKSVSLMVGDEYTANIQLSTYMFAGEGDIYLLTEQYFKSFASQGVFLPLEGFVADGVIQADDLNLSKGYITVVTEYNENDMPVASEQHLFGIPLDQLYGFMDGMQLDNRGMYAAILYQNQNDENVVPFFNSLLQAGRGEKADWMTE